MLKIYCGCILQQDSNLKCSDASKWIKNHFIINRGGKKFGENLTCHEFLLKVFKPDLKKCMNFVNLEQIQGVLSP